MITTSPANGSHEMNAVMQTMMKDVFSNLLIMGDISAPMNKLSDIYKIVEDDKVISGWAVFHGFDVPVVVFPPRDILNREIEQAIKNMVDILGYTTFTISHPELIEDEPVTHFPWENWSGYEKKCLFTDIAMRYTHTEFPNTDVSGLPKIRAATVDDAPALQTYFDRLKSSGEYTGFFHPYQLEGDNYVVAEEDGQIVAVAGTHFETPFTVQLGNIHVLPDYRKKGIGRAISTAVTLGVLRTKRVPTLFVNEHNSAAQAIYLGMGYKEYNRYQFYQMTKI